MGLSPSNIFINLRYLIVIKYKKNRDLKIHYILYPKTEYPELFEDVVLTGGQPNQRFAEQPKVVHPILVDGYSLEEKISHSRIWPNNKEHKLENKFRLLTFFESQGKAF